RPAPFYRARPPRRHVAVFVILPLPYAALAIREVRVRTESVARAAIAAAVVAVIGVSMWGKRTDLIDFAHSSMVTYCVYGPSCSEGMAEYLLKNPPVGRGFNFYDWGGFLIGRGIQTKLFTDGRMTSGSGATIRRWRTTGPSMSTTTWMPSQGTTSTGS